MPSTGPYRLIAPNAEWVAPTLDSGQEQVLAHAEGGLLVLGGPGTGKTTALVEAAVARLRAGRRCLVLTFSRRAAVDLRTRIAGRLGRTVDSVLALTLHGLCLAIVRRFGDLEPFGASVRLLTAPEQEFRVREVLAELGPRRWPEQLAGAHPTQGFAAQLRDLLARTRQLGLDPADVAAAGQVQERPEWVSAGEFGEAYLDGLDFEQALDYGELVHRARLLVTHEQVAQTLRAELGVIYVDEYPELDGAQIGLLRQLSGPGGALVAAGDPDQAVFGFRGAQPRSLAEFGDDFAGPGGPARTLVLGRSHRQCVELEAVTRRVADRLPSAGLPAQHVRALRSADGAPRGARVEAFTFEGEGAQAEHIADLLRVAHVVEGVPWSRMCVLVRSGRRGIPPMRRALVAAGVPVEVAGDEIPLAAELAVRPLLLALDVISRGRRPNADEAYRLLTSPLGGLDSVTLRALGRGLRAAERAESGGVDLPRSSGELIARALAAPEVLADYPDLAGADQARALASLLIQVEENLARGANAQEALWALWSGTSWPERLAAQAAARGESGRRADRDLDAVCALFELAEHSEEVVGSRGLAAFLGEVAAQRIPADTQREGSVRGQAVRVLTAHRAKGREWELVVVAGVQEGVWPDVRRRGTLLAVEELAEATGRDPRPDSAGEILAEERRLFYVAITRATRRLVVTAVAGTDGEADQPSRFIHELRIPVRSVSGRPGRPLNLTGLVAELRRTSVDPQASPGLAAAAAKRLAVLAEARDRGGRPLVPAADPANWWGLLEVTDTPTEAGRRPLRLSGSHVQALLDCPRKWFCSRQVRGESGRSNALTLGSIIHTLAEHAQTEGLELDELGTNLGRVWDQIPFEAAWVSAAERVEAEQALARYAAWASANPRELVGVEVGFEVVVDVDGEPVTLVGSVDRLERESDGRLRVVDFKTGRTAPTKNEVAAVDQLGVYQLAVEQGAFEPQVPGERRCSGAELVFLRQGDGDFPKVMPQASLAEVRGADDRYETWVHRRIAQAAEVLRRGAFPATPGFACARCAFVGSCPATSRQVIS